MDKHKVLGEIKGFLEEVIIRLAASGSAVRLEGDDDAGETKPEGIQAPIGRRIVSEVSEFGRGLGRLAVCAG